MFERYEDGVLRGRQNLVDCEDSFKEDFLEKEKYTPELKQSDLPKLKCLPADQFHLFRDAV